MTCRYGKYQKLIPGFGVIHGNRLTWICRSLICRYFLAGNLCWPADHLHSWRALDSIFTECFIGIDIVVIINSNLLLIWFHWLISLIDWFSHSLDHDISFEKHAHAWHLLPLIFAGFKYYGIVVSKELNLNGWERIEDWHRFWWLAFEGHSVSHWSPASVTTSAYEEFSYLLNTVSNKTVWVLVTFTKIALLS